VVVDDAARLDVRPLRDQRDAFLLAICRGDDGDGFLFDIDDHAFLLAICRGDDGGGGGLFSSDGRALLIAIAIIVICGDDGYFSSHRYRRRRQAGPSRQVDMRRQELVLPLLIMVLLVIRASDHHRYLDGVRRLPIRPVLGGACEAGGGRDGDVNVDALVAGEMLSGRVVYSEIEGLGLPGVEDSACFRLFGHELDSFVDAAGQQVRLHKMQRRGEVRLRSSLAREG